MTRQRRKILVGAIEIIVAVLALVWAVFDQGAIACAAKAFPDVFGIIKCVVGY